MSHKRINTEFLNYSGELPVPILPVDEAWVDMSSRLDKKKKRRVVWWLFLSVFAGLMVLIFLLRFINVKQKNIVIKTSYNVNKKYSTINKNVAPQQTPLVNKGSESKVLTLDKQMSLSDANKTKSLQVKKQSSVYTLQDYRNTKVPNTELNEKKNKFSAALTDTLVTNKIADETTDSNYLSNTKINRKKTAEESSGQDSIENENQPKTEVQVGIGWALPVPFDHRASYFDDAAKPQEWRYLLPGVWVQWTAGKSMFSFITHPFATRFLPFKPFESSQTSSIQGDTLTLITQTKTLHKLFGISAGFSYQYNIGHRWWLGGSLKGNWWSKGLITDQFNQVQKSLNNFFTPISVDSTGTRTLSDIEWKNFAKWDATLNAELLYRQKSWQAGLCMGLSVTPLSRNKTPGNYFYSELVFRLKLYRH